MDAVTYPNSKVIEFLNSRVIPVLVRFDSQPLAKEFNVKWTPTLVTLDEKGEEHHRSVGFLSPEELIPSLLLGEAKIHFDRDDFDVALKSLDRILQEFPRSSVAPEAIYVRGVSVYKSTHESEHLKKIYEELKARFPDSEWTKRAAPYGLL